MSSETAYQIRRATAADFDTVAQLFECAISEMERIGIDQWDSLYPSKQTLKDDMESGQMYVLTRDDTVVASAVLNDQQDEAYKTIEWQWQNAAVIHRLCVHPRVWGQGAGNQMMRLLEQICVKSGYASVRLDAFSQNPSALALYKRLGYIKRGQTQFRKGVFYLLEKRLK